jgi:hypothetical protein
MGASSNQDDQCNQPQALHSPRPFTACIALITFHFRAEPAHLQELGACQGDIGSSNAVRHADVTAQP